jgi:hypothetical protein
MYFRSQRPNGFQVPAWFVCAVMTVRDREHKQALSTDLLVPFVKHCRQKSRFYNCTEYLLCNIR